MLDRRAALLPLAVAACVRPAAYPCTDDAQCDLEKAGVCVAAQGYCAYPDEDCDSSLRFESRAPGSLADACADEPTASSSSGGEDEATGESGSTETTGAPSCGQAYAECCDEFECNGDLDCWGQACGCLQELVVGDAHNCLVRKGGAIECWGSNSLGELGRNDDGMYFADLAPVVDLPQPFVLASAAASTHTCMAASNGSLYCWGNNSAGQVDPDDPSPTIRTARRIDLDFGWSPEVVGVGPEHTCVAEGDRMFCWGGNEGGQLGWIDGIPGEVDTSMMVAPIVQIAAGFAHTCVRTGYDDDPADLHRVYCWGWDGSGLLGAGPQDDSSVIPVEVALDPGLVVVGIAASDLHTCAITAPPGDPDQREVSCWGDDTSGAVTGVGRSAVGTPMPVAGLPTTAWEEVSVGPTHSCASSEEAGAWCWGSNDLGQAVPTEPGGIVAPAAVDAFEDRGVVVYNAQPGRVHSCGATSDGSVTCWGCGVTGQLGEETIDCFEGGAWGAVRTVCEE